MRRYPEALAALDQGLALKPDDAFLISLRENTLHHLESPTED
jgi:hypothetical protein